MKRILLVLLIIGAVSAPAFTQFRFDLNIQGPVTLGIISEEYGIQIWDGATEALQGLPLVLLSGSAYYNFDLGLVNIAAGVRVYTMIIEHGLFPNLLVEIDLHPLYVQAQVGGLMFYFFGLLPQEVDGDPVYGDVLFPDISVWYGFGEDGDFRLGVGVLAAYFPELLPDAALILPYIGGQWSVLVD